MTSKNWTIEQVGNHLRRTVKEGQSMMRPPEPEIKKEPITAPSLIECDCGNKYNVAEGKCPECGKGLGE